jgi:hypothetical protein
MFALVAGGGFEVGQAVGHAYVPQNLLATLYREVFDIDPAATLPDHTGRPAYLLDERDTIRELV